MVDKWMVAWAAAAFFVIGFFFNATLNASADRQVWDLGFKAGTDYAIKMMTENTNDV